MTKLFGTDGVRGIANEQLTGELAYKLGRAGAYILAPRSNNQSSTIIIGMDTRVSGPMLEGALLAGICSVGSDALKLGIVPTPAVAYLTRTLRAAAGVMISASHNPVEDNGIKFFSANGYKLPDKVEKEIERLVSAKTDEMPFPIADGIGSAKVAADALDRYVEFAKKTIDIRLNGVKVVVDCANGAAFKATPQALRELGAEVIALYDQPDGININRNCGSTYPQDLQKAVLGHKAQLGIAHDGDADRLIAVDEKGRLVDGDQIMVVCATYLKNRALLDNNSVVVTVMSNMGLHVALDRAKINVVQTQVGDRYVFEKMQATGSILGGEQSGHIIFLNHNTTGDGLITALQLLKVMLDEGKPLSELAAQMEVYPQVLVNARVKNKNKVMDFVGFRERLAMLENDLGKEGRILVRPSGTEPLIRVMVEGCNSPKIRTIAEDLALYAADLDQKL